MQAYEPTPLGGHALKVVRGNLESDADLQTGPEFKGQQQFSIRAQLLVPGGSYVGGRSGQDDPIVWSVIGMTGATVGMDDL